MNVHAILMHLVNFGDIRDSRAKVHRKSFEKALHVLALHARLELNPGAHQLHRLEHAPDRAIIRSRDTAEVEDLPGVVGLDKFREDYSHIRRCRWVEVQ